MCEAELLGVVNDFVKEKEEGWGKGLQVILTQPNFNALN
jgi:hypothetical protein